MCIRDRLTSITGSEYFPGGLGEHEFEVDWLEFESGPDQTITLQWASYFDAADEAGISRLWGGIHVPADDFAGRIIGSQVGQDAAAYAFDLFVSNDLSWHNTVKDTDVTFDNIITPLDALRVINDLILREYSDGQTGELGGTADVLEAGFLDVNSDGLVTPLDALLVINDLNAPNATLSSSAVPEPSSASLFGIAFVSLLWFRRKKA